VSPDVAIIVENHAVTDTTSSAQFARVIEEFDIFYYEEIITPLHPRLHKLAKETFNIPVALGERIFTRWGFLPFILDRSLDVVQPGLGNSGGLTEVKKITDLSHLYETTTHVHVAGTNVIAAAALRLEAVIPNFLVHEHHQKLLMPADKEITVHDYQPVNGYFTVPELPGLGQESTPIAYERSDRFVIE
jgi:mandelate racemase